MQHKFVTMGRFQNGGNTMTGWERQWDSISCSWIEWMVATIYIYDDCWYVGSMKALPTKLKICFCWILFGKEAEGEYCLGTRKRIRNDKPIVGIYNVNYEGSGDMYTKEVICFILSGRLFNDEQWEKYYEVFKGFYHQVLTGAQIEQTTWVKKTGTTWTFLDQYLRMWGSRYLKYIKTRTLFQME